MSFFLRPRSSISFCVFASAMMMCWLVVWVAQVAPSCLSDPSSLTISPNRPHHFNLWDRLASLSTPAILRTSWKSVCRECRMCQEMTRSRPWRATYDQCPQALAMSNLNTWKTWSIIMLVCRQTKYAMKYAMKIVSFSIKVKFIFHQRKTSWITDYIQNSSYCKYHSVSEKYRTQLSVILI